MSVNLHLSISVRGYDPGRAGAIREAVRELVEREQLENHPPPLAEHDGVLESRTDPDSPVVISRAYQWAPTFEGELRGAVIAANGGGCEVVFDWEDADQDVPDYEPE